MQNCTVAGPELLGAAMRSLVRKDILPFLVGLGRAVAFQFDAYWRDIATLDSYYEANLDLLLASAPLDPYENAYG